jgi:hypothetical protein
MPNNLSNLLDEQLTINRQQELIKQYSMYLESEKRILQKKLLKVCNHNDITQTVSYDGHIYERSYHCKICSNDLDDIDINDNRITDRIFI